MRLQKLTAPAFLCIVLFAAEFPFAQNTPPPNPERDHALEIYKQGKLVEAMPLLEKLSADNPKDIAVMESWGVSVLGYAQTLEDLDLQKKPGRGLIPFS